MSHVPNISLSLSHHWTVAIIGRLQHPSAYKLKLKRPRIRIQTVVWDWTILFPSLLFTRRNSLFQRTTAVGPNSRLKNRWYVNYTGGGGEGRKVGLNLFGFGDGGRRPPLGRRILLPAARTSGVSSSEPNFLPKTVSPIATWLLSGALKLSPTLSKFHGYHG